jgi:hypothetical protein
MNKGDYPTDTIHPHPTWCLTEGSDKTGNKRALRPRRGNRQHYIHTEVPHEKRQTNLTGHV